MKYLDTYADGPKASLQAWLLPLLPQAQEVWIRTGFFTESGLIQLETDLADVLIRGGRLHLLVGGDDEQIDVTAMRRVLDLIEPHKGTTATFHVVRPAAGLHNAKAYYVRRTDGQVEALVGSPNLTVNGLSVNHEAAVSLSSADGDPRSIAEAVRAAMERELDGEHTIEVDADLITAVENRRLARGGSWRLGVAAKSASLDVLLTEAIDAVDLIAVQGGSPGSVLSGLSGLDRLLLGIQPGELVVVAGRPGLGKTNLLLSFCRMAAIAQSQPALFFTLERAAADLTQRLLCAEAKVSLDVVRSGRMSDVDWTNLARAMGRIAGAPLFVSEGAAATVDSISAEIHRAVAEEGVKLVLVDSLQLVTAKTVVGDTREREVSEIVRRLKSVAVREGIALVLSAQVGRNAESRPGRVPEPLDIAESDAVLQTPDVMIMIHREDAYERESPRAGEADLVVSKNTRGRTGICTVAYQGHYCRFVDMAL